MHNEGPGGLNKHWGLPFFFTWKMGLGALGLGGRYPFDEKFWFEIHENSSNEWHSILRNFRKRGQPLQGMTIFLFFFTFLPEFPNFRLNGLLFGNSITYDFLEPLPGNFLIISRSLFGNFRSLYIKHERQCLTTFPNTEKRFGNTTRSGVFLTNFEVFGNVVKHCLECLIYLVNRK